MLPSTVWLTAFKLCRPSAPLICTAATIYFEENPAIFEHKQRKCNEWEREEAGSGARVPCLSLKVDGRWVLGHASAEYQTSDVVIWSRGQFLPQFPFWCDHVWTMKHWLLLPSNNFQPGELYSKKRASVSGNQYATSDLKSLCWNSSREANLLGHLRRSFCEVMPDAVVVKSRIRLRGIAAVLEFTEFLWEIDVSGRTSQSFLQHHLVSLRHPCCPKAVGVAVWFLKHLICLHFAFLKFGWDIKN